MSHTDSNFDWSRHVLRFVLSLLGCVVIFCLFSILGDKLTPGASVYLSFLGWGLLTAPGGWIFSQIRQILSQICHQHNTEGTGASGLRLLLILYLIFVFLVIVGAVSSQYSYIPFTLNEAFIGAVVGLMIGAFDSFLLSNK